MKFPSRKLSIMTGLLSVALCSLAAKPVAAQVYGPQDAYPQPQYGDQYGAPRYQQPQYPSPQPYPDQYPAQPGYTPQQLSYAPQGAAAPIMTQQPMAPEELAQLVAPIALYPDALVAQILAGATYPAQLSAADQFVHQMGMAGPDQMAAAASAQTAWDPSIKALTAYPQVLDMLAGNLQWTTALGNTYYNQPQDVLQTVQVMRMRAQQAGTLVNSPQMQVVQNDGYISLAPPTDDTMYVPTYNPWTSYGDQVQPYPGFSFTGILGTLANAFLGGGYGDGYGSGFGGGALQFLSSFALGAFNRTPFGLISWGLDWLFNALTFHHNDYYTASTSVRDWGFPHGGPRYRYYAHNSYDRGRFGGGFGNRYNHEAIAVHGGARFGGNTFGDRFRSGYGDRSRSGFGNGVRPVYQHQQAFNNRGQMGFRNDYNGGRGQFGNQYGNGFAGRGTQPSRPDYYRGGGNFGGMQSARQIYQNPANNSMRGSMGSFGGDSGSYSQRGSMGNYGGYSQRGSIPNNWAHNNTPNFKQDRSGSSSGFGGGSSRSRNDWGGSGRSGFERSSGFFGGGNSYKQPKFSYKEPKMPKMQSFKAPKEHFSSGGHFSGGGGSHFGGGHSSGGSHGGGGHFGGGGGGRHH